MVNNRQWLDRQIDRVVIKEDRQRVARQVDRHMIGKISIDGQRLILYVNRTESGQIGRQIEFGQIDRKIESGQIGRQIESGQLG